MNTTARHSAQQYVFKYSYTTCFKLEKKKKCKSDIVHAKCKEDMFKLLDGGSKFSVTVHEHMHDVKGHSKIN